MSTFSSPAPPAEVAHAGSILDSIGSTPLLELPRLANAAGIPAGTRLFAKAEHLNPGGSSKDRLALALVEQAEERGLRPGGALIEATSGNTGISLAMIAAIRGYRLTVVASTKISQEKLRVLRALGAEVRLTPRVPHGHPEHYLEVARKLAEDTPGSVYLDQFHSEANAAAHEEGTGPELVGQVFRAADRMDAFVCGVGTGGTLVGIARYLRRTVPNARIVLADPEGSVLSGAGEYRPYLVEGIGDDSRPPIFDPDIVDTSVVVSDRESFRFALLAARCEGILVGGSSGCHLAAAARVATELPSGAVVVTVLPDSGWNYLSKFLDPQWCAANGLAGLSPEVSI